MSLGAFATSTASAAPGMQIGVFDDAQVLYGNPDQTFATLKDIRTQTIRVSPYLGFGATAIGRSPFGHVQNLAETGAWSRAVFAGTLPVGKGVALSPEDRLRGHVIERIMRDGQVDTDAVARSLGAPEAWCPEELETLDAMAADGLLTRHGPAITLTPEGRKLARVVAAVFDSYLAGGKGRHSVAV